MDSSSILYQQLDNGSITIEQYREAVIKDLLEKRFPVELHSDSGVVQFDDPTDAVDAAIEIESEFLYLDAGLHRSRSSTSDRQVMRQIAHNFWKGDSLRGKKCAIVRPR